MATPPTRTPEERDAESHGVLERSALLTRLGSELQRLVADVLIRGARGQTDELGVHARVAGRIKVIDLVKSVHGIGPKRAEKILTNAGVGLKMRVDQISEDHAIAVAEAIG